MITDARKPRLKVLTLMPYRVLPYDNQRKKTQANSSYVDAIQSAAI